MLQDNPKLLLEVLEQSPDAFAHYGPDHSLQHCNRAFVEWFFPDWTRETLIGRPIQEIVEICYACGRIAACNGYADWRAERLRSHRHPSRPYEYRMVDGRTMQGRERALPGGGILSVLTDITEYTRLAEARADSEHRHRQLFENAAIGIYRTSREGSFLEVNPALAGMLGCADPAEFLTLFHANRNFYADPRTRGDILALLDRQGVARDFETQILKKDGTPIWISETAHTVRDQSSEILGYEGFITDISEVKGAKAARAQAAAQLRHAAQMAKLAHWVWDEESGRCIDCSENLTHFSGLPREDFIGITHTEIQSHVHPDDWEEYHRVVEAFYQGGDRFETVFRAVMPDGEVRWCREIGERVPGPDGRPTHSIGTLQDITADRRLQNELREAKEQLQSQLDSSPLAIFTLDGRGSIHSWNPAAEAIFGWTAEEVIGKPISQIQMPPEREHERRELHEKVICGELVRGFETIIKRKDGGELSISVNGAPLTSESGEYCGAVYVIADITEKKRAEANRARVEAQLRHSAQMAKLAHWVWDEESGRCIDCSETLQHFTGVSREAYIGLTQDEVEAFVHPDDWPAYQRIVEAFDRDGERFEAVYRTLPEAGVVRWCREIGERIPGPDGRMTRSIGTLQDITEDRRLQNELREAQEQLQSQLDSSPLAIITLDIAGNILSWNRAAESIFGWSAEEVIGKLSPLIPPEQEHEREEIRLMVARGEEIQDYLTVRRRKDGSMVDISLSAAPLTAESGEISGAVCLVADVTERKRLEAELHKQEALALHAKKLESVATLASGIAHDFNNMLLPIMIAAENLTELLPAGSAGGRDAEQILATAERAAELVRRLLDFSRAEEPKRRRVGMKEAMRQALPLVQSTLPSSIAFQVELAEDCGEVEIDSGQLLQVLLNLVGNAVDAQQQRGRIRLELDVAELDAASVPRPEAMAPGRYARLTLRDEGSGIPPEILPLIFDPFYTTKEVGKGTGLGLAVTHGIVTAHRGGMEVESEPGKGTAFHIYFPLLDEESPQAQKLERENTAV